jgi:hypothetical protein
MYGKRGTKQTLEGKKNTFTAWGQPYGIRAVRWAGSQGGGKPRSGAVEDVENLAIIYIYT